MKDLQVFENSEFGSLTVIEKDGEPWFIGREVASALGYERSADAINQHCKYMKILKNGETQFLEIPSRGLQIINEKDVYRLIMRSKLESAEQFQDWVMDEVLPSIRKDGMYATDDFVEMALSDPDHMISILNKFKKEKQRRLQAEAKVIESKPKVEYYEKVLDTANTYTVTQLAKENEMTAIQLNQILNKCGIQFKQSGQWMLYREYQDQGLVKTRTHIVRRSGGKKETRHSTTWTEKGREFIRELLEDI